MFKELLSALTGNHPLDRAVSELLEMLDHAQWMFVRANEVISNDATVEEVKDALYRRDQSINDLERSIRRKIVRHLTINPGPDAPTCLALMSVAKDAERIGDYCKNVFEVGRFYREGYHVAKYHDRIEHVRQQVTGLFSEVGEAFRDSDENRARQAVRTASETRQICDEIIEELLADRDPIKTHEAVAYSLLARHYKRVAAHLTNIATAVLGKLEDLDFVSRKIWKKSRRGSDEVTE